MFVLGKNSRKELEGVHPDLVRVVERAIETTVVDFGVHDGLRTKLEQANYVQSGVSWTMNSKHLVQSDGFGHAVDLVPYVNGKLRWEWEPIYNICIAVRRAAQDLGVRVRWGGCWSELNTTTKHPRDLVEIYGRMRKQAGKKSNPDGPHYELIP